MWVIWSIRDPDFSTPRTLPPDFSPQSWSVNQVVGSDNCYESNFYLSITLFSSIPTSIYTKNIFHQILGPWFWLMSLLCSVCCIFTTQIRIFSSIQLLVNKKFFHQSSFKLIKNFFHQSSFYLCNFVHQSRGENSGESPRLEAYLAQWVGDCYPHINFFAFRWPLWWNRHSFDCLPVAFNY